MNGKGIINLVHNGRIKKAKITRIYKNGKIRVDFFSFKKREFHDYTGEELTQAMACISQPLKSL